MTLSSVAYIEKNKLATTKAWIVLFKFTIPGVSEPLRLCANTEWVKWPVTNGDIYSAFPLDLGEIREDSKGSVPSLTLKVSNAMRTFEWYLEEYDGLVDSVVNIYVVNSTHVTTDSKGYGINNNNPEREFEFDIIESSADKDWIYFTLGASNPFNKRFPRNMVWRNVCSYKDFKGLRCQYTGSEAICDRTLATCRSYANSINFGGYPGVGSKGVFV